MRPPAHSSTVLEVATLRDAPAIAALRNSTAAHLTLTHGTGPWSGRTSERGVRSGMARGVVYLQREAGELVASLTLSRRKPWAIDPAFFTAAGAGGFYAACGMRERGHVVYRRAPLVYLEWTFA